MTTEELYDKLKLIQKMKCETQNLEIEISGARMSETII